MIGEVFSRLAEHPSGDFRVRTAELRCYARNVVGTKYGTQGIIAIGEAVH